METTGSSAETAASSAEAHDREIALTRLLDAPPELVWRVWTEPEHMAAWWGPNGFTTTVHEMDVRPGGVSRYTMHGPDGTDYPNRVRYREVVRPERLAYDHDDDGAGDHAFQVTVTFEAVEGGTRVTNRMLFPTAEAREMTVKFGAVELGHQTLARLAEYLAASGAPSPAR